ncbi:MULTISPECIES: ABC transporter permease [Haloarcula]|uniref:Sugar ABC transporter permease n=1 Tax=Haloarcula pellucida TaxID=1427151 RepID=A0A830GHL8_9EURY|nr:ABC transporter permease [Halomicroarcula pellucida]MBX0347421.1 ABC transporter permease [Halomicroarcula pellucida]QIO22861.1 ABC transporter permease [Haloarcula sp. JP-L23]GGN88588.1 sugar ABC transporter permease [Halomicroarcula pellucida]
MSTEQGFLGRTFGDRDDVILTLLDNMIWPILAIVILGVLVFVPQTLRNTNAIRLVLWAAVPIGLLVLAESLCLLSGHFDLSIGSIAGFSAMFTGMLLGTCPSCWGVTTNPWAGFGIILVTGSLIGLVNGIMIAKMGLNPFLQTLAFLIIFEGAKTAMQTQPVTGLPRLYVDVGGTPEFAIGVLLFAFLVFGLIMRFTTFGQAVYALGSSEKSAREVGIDTERLIIVVYTISGLLAAIAGLMLTGFVGVVPPLIGEGLVFQAFAGAVIGGISLFGGRGKITGALGGVVLIQLVQSALNNSPVVGATQIQMVNGFVLLAAILLYSTQAKLRARILASGAV